MAVRAKIYVASVQEWGKRSSSDVKVEFGAVYKDDPSHENKSFWKYTPQISFSMTLSKEATGAIEFFRNAMREGTELYLDFAEAPAS